MGLGVTIGAPGAPDSDLTLAASEVVVEARVGQPTRFSIALSLDIAGSDWPLLADPRLAPGAAILIADESGFECLVNGQVHAHRIEMVTGGEGSALEVIGADNSIRLDREAKIVVWPDNTADSGAADLILTQGGFVPDTEATAASHLTDQNALVQRDTDLGFLRMLARRNGYLFWVSSDTAGIDTGHFKPPPVDGDPAASLSLQTADSPLSAFRLHWDVERPTSAVSSGLDVAAKQVLTGNAAESPLTPLGTQSLAALAPGARVALPVMPANDTGALTARANAALNETGFFVTATCTTTPAEAGGVIHAHSLIEIVGAGSLHSGTYFVGAVRHEIRPEAHLMHLTLYRNAWGA